MLVGLLAAALAQDYTEAAVPPINAQTFRPSIDGARTLWVDDADVGPHLSGLFRGLVHYAYKPLVYRYEDGETVDLLAHVAQLDLMGAFRAGPVRLGVDLPVYLYEQGAGGQGAGLGEVAAEVKATALDDRRFPLGLGATARVTFPSATVDAPLRTGKVGYELALVVHKEVGPVLLAANLGTRGGPRVELENLALNDAFVYRVGVGVDLPGDRAGLSAEAAGHVGYAAPASLGANAPAEWLLGGWAHGGRGVIVRLGVGGALSPGIGTPAVRAMLGVGWEPRSPEGPLDVDGDGVGLGDACEREAEDVDAFEDGDGCPDPDNDADAVPDAQDGCPLEPEDADGFADTDGCPDAEIAARVTVLDAGTGRLVPVGRSTLRGEDDEEASGDTEEVYGVAPGLWVVSATAPGYLPASLTFEVADEAVNIELRVEHAEGSRLIVTRGEIYLRESVRFATNSATLLPESEPLLAEVVAVLKDYPEITLLRVGGHTDAQGADDANLALSQRRADAVRAWLIARGIAAERLVAQGFGETQPIDPEDTEAARAKNRRVELTIEAWAER